jgi:hypothetical protein
MSDVPHRLRLDRTRDGVILTSNGRAISFSLDMWNELTRMMYDFNRMGAPSIQNYADLPTRTPVHANTPTKATLDDLI